MAMGSSFPPHIPSIGDMNDQSGASHFRSLFEAALENYKKQTGTKLDDHPLYGRLEIYGTVGSNIAALQEQAQALLKFREEHGKVMKSLTPVVHVLHLLSDSMSLGGALGSVRPKALMSWAHPLTFHFSGIPSRGGDIRGHSYHT